VLWGGNATSVQALLRHYPDLPADKLVHATAEAFLMHYDTLYRCQPAAYVWTSMLCNQPPQDAAVQRGLHEPVDTT
jgi:hypothetical protein